MSCDGSDDVGVGAANRQFAGAAFQCPLNLGYWETNTRQSNASLITCSGAFARDSHHLKLTMTYDRKNVEFGEVDAGAGKSMASIIYPNDPKRRLEVWWSDD